MTSPGFTSPPGIAFLTLARMMSPRYATRRFEPPSTWMHMTSLAPVLSATSMYVYIWIMSAPRRGDAPGVVFLGSGAGGGGGACLPATAPSSSDSVRLGLLVTMRTSVQRFVRDSGR